MQGNGPLAVVDKSWGREVWIVNDEAANYCAKRLEIANGFSCSLHFHIAKTETFVVESGACWLYSEGETQLLGRGEWVRVPAGAKHRFWNDSGRKCVVLEVSNFHSDDDVVRLEPPHKLREEA